MVFARIDTKTQSNTLAIPKCVSTTLMLVVMVVVLYPIMLSFFSTTNSSTRSVFTSKPFCNSDVIQEILTRNSNNKDNDNGINKTKNPLIIPKDWKHVNTSGQAESEMESLSRASFGSYILDNTLMDVLNKFGGDIDIKTPNNMNTLTPSNLLFVIMGSSIARHRIHSLHQTWLQWAPNYLIFADTEDRQLNMKTLPTLRGKASYKDAGQRQLRGMQHIYHSEEYQRMLEEKDIKWVILADDDTFVNIHRLTKYLNQFPESFKLAIGHIWPSVPDYWEGLSYHHGSSIAFSISAFNALAPNLYTKCPCFHQNDITLGYCLPISGVLKVHSELFHPEQGRSMGMHNVLLNVGGWASKGGGIVTPGSIGHYITLHHIQTRAQMKTIYCAVGLVHSVTTNGCRDFEMKEYWDWKPEEDKSVWLTFVWVVVALLVAVVAFFLGRKSESRKYVLMRYKYR